jgi:hypothetical protein
VIAFSGTEPIADSILAGMFQINNQIVQLVLDNLKRRGGMIEIPATITIDKVKGNFDNWKEMTSTSPIMKRHLGHYQCLPHLVDLEEEDERPNMAIAQARQILKVHFLILLMAVKFVISHTH